MVLRAKFSRRWLGIGLIFVTGGFCQSLGFGSQPSKAPVGTHHTPPFTTSAPDLGPMDPNSSLTLRLWLRFRNPDRLQALAKQVIDAAPGNAPGWLSHSSFLSEFAPTSAQLASVQDFLASHGLTIVDASDPLYVTASGKVADIEKALHIQIHQFNLNGSIVHANLSDPVFDGDVGALIQRVGGLQSRALRPRFIRPADPRTKKPFPTIPIGHITPDGGGSFTHECFRDPETVQFTSSDGSTTSTYTGNRYGPDNTAVSTYYSLCAYDPKTVETAYGLNELYQHGLDGSGQTIAIVDAFGSPTIEGDADAFRQQYGLPAVPLSIYSLASSPISGPWNADQQGWAVETTLDVEYAHTVAPGAKIALVEPATDLDEDLVTGLWYVVNHHLADVITNSWGDLESMVDGSTTELYESVLQGATVQGISIQFASGDQGDNVASIGYYDSNFPASGYMTSVGGTMLALNADSSIKFQLGWGNSAVQISGDAPSVAAGAAAMNPPLDPVQSQGFYDGSQGGPSRVVSKPSYQRQVPGTMRSQPDIAYLADPFTGVEIIQSQFDASGNPEPGNLQLAVYGGTSLASPMFAGIWAIATQLAGQSLGLASPILYQLPSDAIVDILPADTSSDVLGQITDASGVTPLSALTLGAPETSANFYSALFNLPIIDTGTQGFAWDVLTFGTDSSFAVTPGWDNVTGMGAPNGLRFVEDVAFWGRLHPRR